MSRETEQFAVTCNWLVTFPEGEDDNLILADGKFSRVFRDLNNTPGTRVELQPRQVGKLEKPSYWDFAVYATDLALLKEAHHKLVATLQWIEQIYQIEVAVSVNGDAIPPEYR